MIARVLWLSQFPELRPATALAFHHALADTIVSWCVTARRDGAPNVVALTGGCFGNRILLRSTVAGLRRASFVPVWPSALPAGDGGISVGQAAVAASRAAQRSDAGPGRRDVGPITPVAGEVA